MQRPTSTGFSPEAVLRVQYVDDLTRNKQVQAGAYLLMRIIKFFKRLIMKPQTFDLLIDGTPYEVIAVAFMYNGEKRYRVSFNGSPIYVFVWDSSMKKLKAIGEDAGSIPSSLEIAIADKLQQDVYA